jgi:hypothetical protein
MGAARQALCELETRGCRPRQARQGRGGGHVRADVAGRRPFPEVLKRFRLERDYCCFLAAQVLHRDFTIRVAALEELRGLDLLSGSSTDFV